MKRKLSIIMTIIGIIAILIGITIIIINSNNNNKEYKENTMSEIENYELLIEQIYYKEGTTIKYKETLDDGTYIFERYQDGKTIESYKVSEDGKTIVNSQSDEEIVGENK